LRLGLFDGVENGDLERGMPSPVSALILGQRSRVALCRGAVYLGLGAAVVEVVEELGLFGIRLFRFLWLSPEPGATGDSMVLR
jgi:hypothetical protein